MMIGLILGPIPYLMYLGAIFAIIGAIMVILGQNRFDPKHTNNTIRAAVIYVIGFGIIFFATSVFANSIAAPNGKTVNLSQALTDKINGFLVAWLIGTVVIAVAYVLFTYSLQDKTGRLLLYVSFAAQLAFGALAIYIVSGQVASAVSQSLPGRYYDPTPINSLLVQIQELQLLGLFPAGLFAISYYRVYSRIGEMFPRQ